MYLAGVSVRRVEDITEALWGTRVSPGTVSNLNKKIYAQIEAWRMRPTEGKHPYLYLDGIVLARIFHGSWVHRGSGSGKVLLQQSPNRAQRSSPMPTECSSDLFGFSRVEGRAVVAAFDGGAVSADAGALLLGAADRAIGLVDRFGVCFEDGRAQEQVVHRVRTLVAQRVFAIALG